MSMSGKDFKNLGLGLAFLTPNIIGFMVFLLVPLVLSLAMAFTNWDLTQHNQYKNVAINFVGVDNFIRLFTNREFFTYLGNTLFLMMGIPVGIAGSLGLAILLTKDFRGASTKIFVNVLGSSAIVISVILLLLVNAQATAITILLTGVFGLCLAGGFMGGKSVYRTLVYLPSFTAGVAVYILWQKLYNPNVGPINMVLQPAVNWINESVPTSGWTNWTMWILLALGLLIVFAGMRRLLRLWRDGDSGSVSLAVAVAFVALPCWYARSWITGPGGLTYLIAGLLLAAVMIVIAVVRKRDFTSSLAEGFGSASMLGLGVMVAEFILIGFASWMSVLPQWTAVPGGLQTPGWLSSFYWAKPAIMVMGIWSGIGSSNMLLYVAGISGIPQELYEAADIDGVSPSQRFWNITWPQLAPTTFFIVVMSIIGGLQGGFEQARVMTQGGPAGATTTLSYFIYTEGFTTGRLGYSSAVAWTLFALVFIITMINWRFGNRYVND